MTSICIHSDDKSYRLKQVTIPKVAAEINEKTIPNTNALGGRIWEGPEIYWKRESSYQFIEDQKVDKIIEAAFLEASLLTPLRITKKNKKTADAHIIINFLGKKDDSYFTSPSTLAYGYGPGKGLGGNVTMNSDVLWLLRSTPLLAKEAKELGYITNYANPNNKIRYYDPLHTLKHEGGHALGMKHIEETKHQKSAIMYPIYNGLRIFGDEDVNYITNLYGKEKLDKKIMDTINTRIESLFRT